MPRPRTTHIPKPFRFAHNFAFYLHDVLVHHLVSGEQADIFSVHIERPAITNLDIDTFSSLHGEELWQWLEDSDHGWVLDEMVYRQTLAAVLSDLLHFVFEALCCSQKSKLTVTYALLRKPLRENLLILEWLLGDPKAFCTTFRNSSPHAIDLSRLKPDEKRDIITKSCEAIGDDGLIDPNTLFLLRYDKHAPEGFEYLWNKATHLITTFKAYETEPQNFNFIFSDESARQDQWVHIYTLLPLLLYHAVDVVVALTEKIARMDGNWTDSMNTRRLAGFLLWRDSIWLPEATRVSVTPIEQMRRELSFECPECSASVRMGKRAFASIYNRMAVRCHRCKHQIQLDAEDDEDANGVVSSRTVRANDSGAETVSG